MDLFLRYLFYYTGLFVYPRVVPNGLNCYSFKTGSRGTWVAQSVKRLALAQVMISWSVSSSPASGSVLTAQSLEPASESVSASSLIKRYLAVGAPGWHSRLSV